MMNKQPVCVQPGVHIRTLVFEDFKFLAQIFISLKATPHAWADGIVVMSRQFSLVCLFCCHLGIYSTSCML